jgi:hypothetical protein
LKGDGQRRYLRGGKQNEHNTGETTQSMPPGSNIAKPDRAEDDTVIRGARTEF